MTDAPNPSAAKAGEHCDVHHLLVEFANSIKGASLDKRIEYLRVFTDRINALTHPQPSLSVGLDREAVARIRKLAKDAAKIAPGLWGSDIEESEGEYGAGDETHTGFFVPYMETEHGKRLFDAHYCDVAEVHEDFGFDENGANHHAWDENSRVIFEFLTAVQPQNIIALADAILALAAPAEGYVLVPVEPTEAMIEAGEKAAWDDDNAMPAIRAMPKAYRAMIAACLPAAPTGEAL